jgi:hypothetical protein
MNKALRSLSNARLGPVRIAVIVEACGLPVKRFWDSDLARILASCRAHIIHWTYAFEPEDHGDRHCAQCATTVKIRTLPPRSTN